MGKSLSTDSPTEENRTIWPIVLTVLHLIGFIGGFFVAIPTSLSLSHVSIALH